MKKTKSDTHKAEPTRYFTTTWRNKWLTANATTISEMAAMLEEAAKTLREMDAAGVRLDDGGMPDDYAELYTYDPKVAERFGFHEEEVIDDFVDDVYEESDA